MTRGITSLLIAFAGSVTLSGCSSIDVNDLPAPGNSFSDGYTVVMEFANVLNLPARAKVTLDGFNVGIVTGVSVASDHVDVSTRIDPKVSIPSDIRAGLQQATVLGDIYVALDRPQAGAVAATALTAGARIPLVQTSSPPQLEDTIAHLADFVGSGSIQRVQNTIVGINRITPASGDIRRIATQFTADVNDLSDNIDTVDKLLTGVTQTAQVLHDRKTTLQDAYFSPTGLAGWKHAYGLYQYAGTAYPSLGSIYSGGFWLVPFLNSAADAAGAVQTSKWAFESEVPKWRKLFTDYFLPQDKYPAINITSIEGPDGRELSGNVQDVLRILGATP
jgi:virulence factor Mce-like protein